MGSNDILLHSIGERSDELVIFSRPLKEAISGEADTVSEDELFCEVEVLLHPDMTIKRTTKQALHLLFVIFIESQTAI